MGEQNHNELGTRGAYFEMETYTEEVVGCLLFEEDNLPKLLIWTIRGWTVVYLIVKGHKILW